MTRQEKIQFLLANPELLLMKKPFLRGCDDFSPNDNTDGKEMLTNGRVRVRLPKIYKKVVTQDRFAKELDPMCHEVMFDDNLPSICVKLRSKGSKGHPGQVTYTEVENKRMGLPFQERIRERKTLTVCGNRIEFTQRGSDITEQDRQNYTSICEAWTDRNQDGMITKAVYTQLGYGDAGLLYYRNHNGEIKSRLISYEDGYVIISHNDNNGERLLEVVYYADENGVEHIDCYDDRNIYHMDAQSGWDNVEVEKHGFREIPLATKRGDVAHNAAQSLIEAYEILYNIYIVIEKRHGWGILYIRGKINESLKKIAGSIILNDTSIDGNGSAEFKAPPSPQGYLDTLESLRKLIQIASSCTFLLPEDIKTGGDISGVAVALTQSLDLEGATAIIKDWQNFLDKCVRLFSYGYAQELVEKGENPTAITDFAHLKVSAKMKIWRPFSESEYNQMLATLKGAGILSKKTAIEKNTVSQPDEAQRILKEEEEARKLQEENMLRQAALATSPVEDKDEDTKPQDKGE